MRVEVTSGDGKEFLGFGTLLGEVTTYAIQMPDETILSARYAEKPPSEEMVRESGGTLITIENNPKILMDDGSVVYGCQVWWSEWQGDNEPCHVIALNLV